MAESESDVLPVTLTGITRKRQDSNLRWALTHDDLANRSLRPLEARFLGYYLFYSSTPYI